MLQNMGKKQDKVKKRTRKSKYKNRINAKRIAVEHSRSSSNEDSSSGSGGSSPSEDFTVCLKYKQPSCSQLQITNSGNFQIQAAPMAKYQTVEDKRGFPHSLNADQDSKFQQVQYPYTGLLSKQVQSYGGKPLFYYEVKLMGDAQ